MNVKFKLHALLLIVLGTLSYQTFAQCPPENVSLSSQTEIIAFLTAYPNCQELNGSLYISSDSVTDISGLSNLTSILGALNLHQTACPELYFPNLTEIGGNLSLHQTTCVKVNLPNLSKVAGNLYFHQNMDLDSVDVPLLSGSVQSVYFHQNRSLKKANLCSIDSVYEYVYFNENDSLTDMCLDQLTNIREYLYINGCNSLTNLNTFSNLVKVDEYLYIAMNNALSNCSGICPLLDANGVTGEVNILNNPSPCSSQTEVSTSCSSTNTNGILSKSIYKVYPNPATDVLFIETDLSLKNAEISLIDALGKETTLLIKNTEKGFSLDVSTLAKGLYFLEIEFDGKLQREKVVLR
jgi:hypothetical protein